MAHQAACERLEAQEKVEQTDMLVCRSGLWREMKAAMRRPLEQKSCGVR